MRFFLAAALCLSTAHAIGQSPPRREPDRARDVLVVPRDKQPDLKAGVRHALVVGINDYEHLDPLNYAEKDAKDMAAALQALDFVVEAMHSDAKSPSQAESILLQVTRMCVAAEPADTLLVYLSGHGFSEPGGAPYFCARQTDPKALELTGLKLDWVIEKLRKSKARRRMLVIDACRNLPHKGGPEQRWDVDQLAYEGLAVLYSTSDGAVSLEPSGNQKDLRNREMQNGIFTHYLLRGLEGDADDNGDRWITFRELAFHVNYEVRRETKSQQKPRSIWDGDAGFDIPLRALPLAPAQPSPATASLPPPPSNPPPGDKPADKPVAPPEPPAETAAPEPEPDRARELEAWAEIVQREPDPTIVKDAVMRDRIQQSRYPWKVRDKATGITMVLVPGGTFSMGSPADEPGREDDEVQHQRTIQRAFYLGECEVMIWQWNRDKKGGNGDSDDRPQDNKSWDEIQAWLKRSGASKLRLPTEAEWEYACRAGSDAAYATGATLKPSQANFAEKPLPGSSATDARKYLRKANEQHSNAFGARGMHGNLWEWVQDAYGSYRAELRQDANDRAGAPARVIRGGCFGSKASNCRSAEREKMPSGKASVYVGFRVARSLP